MEAKLLHSKQIFGAEGGIRTPTELPPQDPESCVSANSTTSAKKEVFT